MPGFRRGIALSLSLALAVPALAGEGSGPFSEDPPPRSSVRQTIGALAQAAQPAYRFVEAVSDGFYDFVRTRLVANILPGRLNKKLARAPEKDSHAAFEKNLETKETRYLERLAEAYPVRQDVQTGYYNPAQMEQWSSWAREEQVSVAVDAFRDTLADRYQLPRFGRTSERYARDRRNWDPGFLAVSGVVGGMFAYFNGIHTDARVGDFKLRMDLRAGMKIRQAVESGSGASRAAGLELGYKDSPLSFSTDWGAGRGGLYGERFGLKYRLRY